MRVGVARLSPEHLLACPAHAREIVRAQAALGLKLQVREIFRRLDGGSALRFS